MVSLNAKIVGGIAVTGLVCAVAAGAGVFAVSRLGSELESSLRSAQVVRAHMQGDMMHDAIRADVIGALEATIIGSGFGIDQVAADFAEHSKSFRESIATASDLATDQATRDVLKAVEAPLLAYEQSARTIIDMAAKDASGARAAYPGFMRQFSELEDAMEAAADKIEASAAAEADAALAFSELGLMLMLGLLAAGIAVAGGVVLVARRQVVRPLLNVTDVLDRLARGDLTAQPARSSSDDEIGRMNAALQAFRQAVIDRQAELEAADQREALEAERARNEQIQAEQRQVQNHVVTSIATGLSHLADGDLTFRINEPFPPTYESLREDFNRSLAVLSDAILGIHQASATIRSGSGEISKAADDLSLRTQQQASSLEETAAALNEITSTVRSTSEGADKAHQAAVAADTEVKQGGSVVAEAIAAMSTIERSSSEIGQIIGVIDEIAFQTNLLALNAGVEAARAGESGKGFAVVASEVRALAQRSAEAAKQIKALINASTAQVAVGVDLVGRTGTVLERLASHVERINAVVAEIAGSARSQANGLTEINTAVDQMDRVTQQNAAMVEETTAASHSLANEAAELTQRVNRFRVGAANAGSAMAGRPAPAPSRPQARVIELAGVAMRKGAAREPQPAPAANGWEEF
ncbi:MAG TPA: HAMP domain-containing protein [Rhizobiales bacterium]|nr:HAMP domain-containing protein [Hyphomicrobiales bacterium]